MHAWVICMTYCNGLVSVAMKIKLVLWQYGMSSAWLGNVTDPVTSGFAPGDWWLGHATTSHCFGAIPCRIRAPQMQHQSGRGKTGGSRARRRQEAAASSVASSSPKDSSRKQSL